MSKPDCESCGRSVEKVLCWECAWDDRQERLSRIAAIIEGVEKRSMAATNWGPTIRDEITGSELSEIYKLAKGES